LGAREIKEFVRVLLGGAPQAKAVIAIILLGAATMAILLVTAFFQRRELSFWPPQIGPCSGNPAASQAALHAKEHIKISKVFSKENALWAFEVEGTCENIPQGCELWIMTTTGSGLSSQYWPQGRAVTKEGIWKGHIYGLGGRPGDKISIGIFLVGRDGQVLLEYWKAAGKKYDSAGRNRLPLTRLTRDIHECDEMELAVKTGRTPGTAN